MDDLDVPSHAGASASGIVECLRMLAEEAGSLRLVRTLMALLETLAICQIEAAAIGPLPTAAEPRDPGGPPPLLLH